ncbi:endolytic transglycosylase MltG [Helicobacter sp.]|uniref:endolytic transglycosylase MltG n=1 Tax=Helicobacter sp. TaxID=218 RepID=UPI0025B83E0A|nr:endolytic transglycosylase MltG [Helicobacter sp.]MCI5633196.1 endolytic transglycosylase MltG [Helicobacter sp.]MDY5556753.1 endolytic transglycosylase MltG [Helicobacter sp.]
MNTPINNVKNKIIFNVLLDGILVLCIIVCFYLQIPMTSSRVVYIPKGGTSEIITYLRENNFDLNKNDKHLLRFFGYPQSGWLDIGETTLSKGDFFYKLTNAKAVLEDITLIPGETLYYFIKAISEKLNLNEASLWAAYQKYTPIADGVILANTYKVPKGISASHLMYYLVNTSLNEHKKWAIKFLGEYDERQWFRYIIIASIIQKESANEEEMPLVSAVIRNRLEKKMRLQMDGTLNYGQYSHTKVTPEMIRNDTTHYNTYRYDGIPEAPVGSVSFKAIQAAIFPANVDYLYFVRNKNGVHSFTKNYDEHLKNFSK